MRILLAEDRISLQTALKLLIEDWHFVLDTVEDGLQVIEQVDRQRYDLCILDMRLPGLNGEQAAKAIREKRFLPILALTADPLAMHPHIFDYVDDYLEKPFDIEVLHQKIMELTAKSALVTQDRGEIRIEKEPPKNPADLKRLRQLFQQGWTFLTVQGPERAEKFIVHPMIPTKIFTEFFLKGKELVDFLDHNSDKPRLCHLYKYDLVVNVATLSHDEYELLRLNEKQEMIFYTL